VLSFGIVAASAVALPTIAHRTIAIIFDFISDNYVLIQLQNYCGQLSCEIANLVDFAFDVIINND
jgi:hypothetical protein